ncbi:MAG TPA: hypothetical protein PK514_12160 [Spirochaetota bacterium]|nr:hypothetical protein [Spirochaetota bacterium]
MSAGTLKSAPVSPAAAETNAGIIRGTKSISFERNLPGVFSASSIIPLVSGERSLSPDCH